MSDTRFAVDVVPGSLAEESLMTMVREVLLNIGGYLLLLVLDGDDVMLVVQGDLAHLRTSPQTPPHLDFILKRPRHVCFDMVVIIGLLTTIILTVLA